LVPIVGEGMSGAMVEQVMDAMSKAVDQRSEKAKAVFDQISARGGAKLVWRQETGPEPVVLAAAGRLSAPLLLGRPETSMGGPTAGGVGAALCDAGQAVLGAPPTAQKKCCPGVALAWNGSAEAARVVGVALPYLTKAENVTILSAPGTDKRAPAEALAAYLA